MNIGLCDDNEFELNQIKQICEHFIQSHSLASSVTYKTFQNPLDLIAAIESGEIFDILLLDVVMPLCNGIELAKELRKKNNTSIIIFLTSASEYAVASYDVRAFHYLLKPINKEKLIDILDKAVSQSLDQLNHYIIIKYRQIFTKVFFAELYYVEVINKITFFYLQSGDILQSSVPLSTIEQDLLCDDRFIKPHRSYIINMNYIKSISSCGITMISGNFIPVSRNVYPSIKQAYLKFSFSERISL